MRLFINLYYIFDNPKKTYLRKIEMKFGFVFPLADVFKAIELARAAEEAGWNSFFVWEPFGGLNQIGLHRILIKYFIE
jgi:hypothetical protein